MQSIRLLVSLLIFLVAQNAIAEGRVISSLGRLEPENGVLHLAGPSGGGLTGAVLTSLAAVHPVAFRNGQRSQHRTGQPAP